MVSTPPGPEQRSAERLAVELPKRVSGLTIMAFFAVGIGGLAARAWWVSSPYALVFTGVAVMLASIAVFFRLPRVASLEADPQAGRLSLRLHDGQVARLPRGAIAEAEVTRHENNSSNDAHATYGARLRKNDGGTIELCKVGYEDDANVLVARIAALLDSVPASTETESTHAEEARRRLEQSPLVHVERLRTSPGRYRDAASEELVIRWSLKPSPRFIAILSVGAGGLISAVLSAILADRFGLLHAVLVVLAMLFLAALLRMRDADKTQEVRTGDDELTLTTRRGAKSLVEKRLPLAAVAAVDVNWNSGLMIRIDEANRELEKIGDVEEALHQKRSGLPLGAFLGAVRALARQTIVIDTGTLPLQLRIDLETVLDAEIAARSGRVAAGI